MASCHLIDGKEIICMHEKLNSEKGLTLGVLCSGGFPLEGDLTLGSLFSGSGSFELAGLLAGVKPVWLSEVEPFPLRVTEKRLSGVKQYGDVSKLKGGDLEAVDIITFGSP